jgi:Fe-S oxidoreductase
MGNALCLTFAAREPMCPSFKVTGQALHSPKGRAEALKLWGERRQAGTADAELERSVHAALDGGLGCKACATSCPVLINIPELKSRFLTDYHTRHGRRLADRLLIGTERFQPLIALTRPLASLPPVGALLRAAARMIGIVDAPVLSRRGSGGLGLPSMTAREAARGGLPANAVLLAVDALTGLFDTEAIADIGAGLTALGFAPVVLLLPPGGKTAHVKGDRTAFLAMARKLWRRARRAAGGRAGGGRRSRLHRHAAARLPPCQADTAHPSGAAGGVPAGTAAGRAPRAGRWRRATAGLPPLR